MDIDLTNAAAAAHKDGPPIRIQLLALVDEARNEHGMRQQDYQRYRHYCTQKLHRLRTSLHLTHNDGSRDRGAAKKKGAKATKASKKSKRAAQTPAAQSAANKGKGNVYTNKTISVENVDNDRPLQLLLFEAERAWAHSQDLRVESFANDEDAAIRRHGLKRAKRAVHWAQQLFDLVEALGPRVEPLSRAEVAAYLLTLKGSLHFDKGSHGAALRTLSVLRVLLTKIAKASPTSRAEALANSFVDAGEAQIRYCAYQLGDTSQDMEAIANGIADDEACQEEVRGYTVIVDALIGLEGKAEPKQTLQITWHGKQVPVRNAELLDAVVRVQAEEKALELALEAQAAAVAADGAKAKVGPKHKRARLTHAERNAKKRASKDATSSNAAPAAAAAAAAGAAPGHSKTEMDPYDKALSALTDAEELARSLVEDNAKALAKSHSARYEAASADLKLAHDYLLYRLLSLRIRRNVHLVDEVERKADKREQRAKEKLERRLEAQAKGKPARTRPPGAKRHAFPPKPAKRNVPGSRAKRPRSTGPPTHRRRPGHSGTRKLRAAKAASLTERARAVDAAKSRRRSARAVPGIARLLDVAETSLGSMAGLGLVESEADVSSLVEAKAAWFKAELLRHLSRAYLLSGAYGHSLLLLSRASLYVRQAREAAELAEDAKVEDKDAPPRILDDTGAAGEDALGKLEKAIEEARREAQKEMFFAERGYPVLGAGVGSSSSGGGGGAGTAQGAEAMAETKAGQVVKDLATRHIDFDPLDMDEACRFEENRHEDLERALREEIERRSGAGKVEQGRARKEERKKPAKAAVAVAQPPTAKAAPVPAAKIPQQPAVVAPEGKEKDKAKAQSVPVPVATPVVAAPANEDDGDEAEGPYDPANAMDEEEDDDDEDEVARQQQQKKGWLGGWFARK